MRKIASLLTVLMLLCTLAFAQTKTVSGKVTDEQGNPIPFASILIKGTSQGAVADQTGSFQIKVKSGDILVLSSQGFSGKEITVGDGPSVNAVMTKASDSMVEVIVSSGYNTKKTQRSLTSNAQVVASEQLNTIRQSNLNNALAGKVAGVQIRSQSVAALGRDANVRLRGDGTLGGQGILYIVDGTPVNSVDINPDDIEDLTVLNGPTGAAIYGPQAADGAIVINTKRAKRGQKGIGVEINSGIQFDKIYTVPNYQNSYAGGNAYDMKQFKFAPGMPAEWQTLDGKYYHDYTDDASWGPRMVGQEYIPWYAWYPGTKYSGKTASLTPQPDNARDFFNTGITNNNNINFSKAGEGYSARVSYTNLDIKGLIPTSYLRRHTLAANGSFDLGNLFTLGTNFNYVTQNQKAENDDGYANQSQGSFNQWFHRDLDMGIMKELRYLTAPDGSLASWNKANAPTGAPSPTFYKGNYWYNFYSYFDNIENLFRRDRLYGDVSLTYKVTNEIKLRGAYRKNFVTTWGENKVNYILERSATQTGLKAGYGTNESYFKDDRFEFTGTYNKKFNNFSVDFLVGGEIVKIQAKSINANTRDGLYIPDFFTLSNSISPIAYGNFRSEEKRRALFTRGSLGWKNLLFGEFTIRNDWYSTLPVAENNILVKSVGLSFVFSDLVKESMPWLTYGKLRGSWGEVPQAIGPYGLSPVYGVGADTWSGSFVMGTPNNIVDPNIKGAVQATKELGLDLRFFKSRLGISATYYDAVTKNSPISVAINGASGFTQQQINAGKITRKGLEFQLFARPIALKGFSWEINATYAKILDNKVVELAPGVDQITVEGGVNFSGITTPLAVHQVGQQWGMIIGGGKKYIDGVPVLDPVSGSYIKEENKRFGSVLPSYTGGVQNSISYKNFVLNVNIDYQWGGKFFSLSDMWGSYSGLLARTAVLNDKGIPIRDRVADGGGVHVTGVDESKNKVDMYVEAQDYFHNMVGDNVYDEFIYDLTFVKLREVSLGYRIPVQKLGFATKWLQNATFSVVARNPWLIYAKTKDFDPSEISNVFGENGQFPGTRSLGFNLKLGF
ncbi:MAG: SusC/RagA family TonB-linked outer membrane protein [Chitinophagaceae bacterium]